MSIGSIIGILGFQHLLLTEGVDEGRASCVNEREDVSLCQLKRRDKLIFKTRTCTAGTTDHQTELNSFLDIFLATELDLKSDTNSTEATSAATRSRNQGRDKGIELTRMGYNVEGGGESPVAHNTRPSGGNNQGHTAFKAEDMVKSRRRGYY